MDQNQSRCSNGEQQMKRVRYFPEQAGRVETGPIGFGCDRRGVFISGDDSLCLAALVKPFLKGTCAPLSADGSDAERRVVDAECRLHESCELLSFCRLTKRNTAPDHGNGPSDKKTLG